MGKKSKKKEKKTEKSKEHKRKDGSVNGILVLTDKKKKHKEKRHKKEKREKKKRKKNQENKIVGEESIENKNTGTKLSINIGSEVVHSSNDEDSPILPSKRRPKLALLNSDDSLSCSSNEDEYRSLSKKERRRVASAKFKTDLMGKAKVDKAGNDIMTKLLLEDTDDESNDGYNNRITEKKILGQRKKLQDTKLRNEKKKILDDKEDESNETYSQERITQNKRLGQYQKTPRGRTTKTIVGYSPPEKEDDANYNSSKSKGVPSEVSSMFCQKPNKVHTNMQIESGHNQPQRRQSSRISKRKMEEVSRQELSSSGLSSDDNGEDLFDTDSSSSSHDLLEEEQELLSEIDSDAENDEDEDCNISSKKTTKHSQNTSGPLNYAALNFQMHMADIEANERKGVAEFLSAKKSLTVRDAFGVWLDDLAHQAEAHLKDERDYISSAKQARAASQIERPFCTRRESTLGSTAWKEDFRKHLCSRPIYKSVLLPIRSTRQRSEAGSCDVCGRSNHNASHIVVLSGPCYDAQRTWEYSREKRHTDWKRCLQAQTTTKEINRFGSLYDHIFDSEEDNAPEKDGDMENRINTEENSFRVGNHCRARTELYHHLLHYKFRLFDIIQGRLLGNNSNVVVRAKEKAAQSESQKMQPKTKSELRRSRRVVTKLSVQQLMADKEFVVREFRRYNTLLQNVEDQWGIASTTESQSMLWANDDEIEKIPNGSLQNLDGDDNILPTIEKKKRKKNKKVKKRKKHDKKKRKEEKRKKKEKKGIFISE